MQTKKAMKGPCSKCGSSDALVTYFDHTWCYSCETYGSVGYETEIEIETKAKVIPMNSRTKRTFKTADITDRKITAETCKKYGVTVAFDNQVIVEHKYDYHDKDGNYKASKYRSVKIKDFWS